MANLPVNFNGVILTAGNSTTGSFGGIMSLGTGSISAISGSLITGLKYYNGYNAGGAFTEATVAAPFTLPAGSTLPLAITSCSLGANSAPVILYL
jgi:hypothetical protein